MLFGAMPSPIRVMLVDDDSSARFLLETILGDHPDEFTVVAEVGRASDALECLAETRPDVVLLDARMPMTDGYALAGELLSARPDIRMILLSAMVDEDVRRQARAAGIHA